MASRRFESTAASKASEAAKDTASKAQQGLSRVTSAAGPAIAGAARGVGNALGKIGGRTGRLIAFVERECFASSAHRFFHEHRQGDAIGVFVSMLTSLLGQTPFVVYYSKVGAEVAKLVFQGQKMSPPYVAMLPSSPLCPSKPLSVGP